MRLWPFIFCAVELLGPLVRQDGYAFRPPREFRMARMDLFQPSRATALGPPERGFLSALLFDGDDENAASFAMAVVDEPLEDGFGARDELAARVARHFREGLGLEFSVEGARTVDGPVRRIEVRGSLRRAGQLRQIVVAAWPGPSRHLVATVSVPSGRYEGLSGAIGQSFDTVRLDAGAVPRAPRTVALAVALLVTAGLLVSVGLWRRRQARRGAGGGPATRPP